MSLCNCSGNSVVIVGVPPGSCLGEGCIFVPHVLIKSVDSIYPCNETISIDMSDKLQFNSLQNNSIVEFEIIEHTSNFTNVYFQATTDRSSIQIIATSNFQGLPAEDYKWGKIVYKVQQGRLSNIASATVIFKSYCTSKLIPTGCDCDPCTGNIICENTDLEITDGISPDLDITIN